jgi:hypothetical protein
VKERTPSDAYVNVVCLAIVAGIAGAIFFVGLPLLYSIGQLLD